MGCGVMGWLCKDFRAFSSGNLLGRKAWGRRPFASFLPQYVISTVVEKSIEHNFLLYRIFRALGLASAHRRRRDSYLFLDEKVTKNQGLELMLDKLVETLFATEARNEEKSFLPLFWFLWFMDGCAQVSTASPSIISYAG
ncbi:hypothetical protein DRW42_27210 [Pedobacter miscanthi]|uniref:Uncharacterized protein n=1 Tax=Pedobacter miscanthi TaxID=2259170 RepID=A0A366KMI3_9SPHI|nr:hypothetical protein DRW42_27210 [Pedobacter miscanthi]